MLRKHARLYRIEQAIALVSAWCALLAPRAALAQGPNVPATTRAEVTAAPLSGSIHVDGRLDEPGWRAAVPFDAFTQQDPDEGRSPTERTEVRILLGPDALYIGARMFDTSPRSIRALLTRRDADSTSDKFAVRLDSRHDHRTAFIFEVNPRGVRRDGVTDAAGMDDFSIDPIWDVATTTDSAGWTAEIRIPLSQLRFQHGAPMWGLQLMRYIQRKQETDVLAYSPKSEQQGVSQYAHLLVATRGVGGGALEIAPYASTSAQHTPGATANALGSHDVSGNAGVDLKYALSGSLALNATINPDFGQVEVDPSLVNLSAFEPFYPEKRPFFLEGASLFNFAQVNARNAPAYPSVFYSRRIGRAPQGQMSSINGGPTDAPAQTAIPVAVKLTGKTTSGWSIAMMDAVTQAEHGSALGSDGNILRQEVEPLTNYQISRIQHEDQAGNTTIGGLLTTVTRHFGDTSLVGSLRASALTAGVDMAQWWDHRRWVVDGFFVGTNVTGSARAIAATQRLSSRYYQRPDAVYTHYDSTRTSLSGYNALLAISRANGGHWLGSLSGAIKTPGFEVNDIGREVTTSRRALATNLAYVNYKPGPLFRNYSVNGYTYTEWNFDGQNVTSQWMLNPSVRLRNYWNVSGSFDYHAQTFDDQLTRGGPVTVMPASGNWQLMVGTDPRNSHVLASLMASRSTSAKSTMTMLNPTIAVNLTSALRLTAQPSYMVTQDNSQYVRTVKDPTATETYNARYVFATLDQKTLSLDTRLDWTLARGLSAQVYLQPFVSAAQYQSLKELHAPRTNAYDVYGVDRGSISTVNGVSTIDPDGAGPATSFTVQDPSFNARSVRANAVIRWEYRRGSTLYFVWQQNREDDLSSGSFALGRDLGAAFGKLMNNTFAIKASYWFSP